MHIVRCTGRKENGSARKIGWLTPAARRNAAEDFRVALFVRPQSIRIIRCEVSGRDGVDVDAVLRPLVGEQLSQARDAAFGRRVARHPDAALEGQHRRDVDDLAAFAGRHHRTRHGL